jgi:hypothetical protein
MIIIKRRVKRLAFFIFTEINNQVIFIFPAVMKEIIKILKYKLVGLNFLLVVLSGVLMTYSIYIVPVFFILASNLYDILGYHFALIRRSKVMPEKIIIRSYRITQLMFDLSLLILISVVFSPVAALSGAILKVFGVQDVLYYIFLQMELPERWTWLKWTPLGFFSKSISKNMVIVQTIIGTIFAGLIFYLI